MIIVPSPKTPPKEKPTTMKITSIVIRTHLYCQLVLSTIINGNWSVGATLNSADFKIENPIAITTQLIATINKRTINGKASIPTLFNKLLIKWSCCNNS